jgi:hypothetical protein
MPIIMLLLAIPISAKKNALLGASNARSESWGSSGLDDAKGQVNSGWNWTVGFRNLMLPIVLCGALHD